MAENLKSRHAFGSEANVDSAIERGLIDAHDILFLSEGKIGWIDKDGKKVILEDKEQVLTVEELPETGELNTVYICNSKFYFWNGTEFKPAFESGITEEEVNTKIDTAVENAMDTVVKIKYEITSKPVGTLVNYGENEIRVMCPANTEWVKQNVGENGNANMYYMAFKAYAPEGAVSFKEGDRGVVEDKMFTFNDDFAGTDEFGRNYSIVWLALATYDEDSDTWTYFGKNSTLSKYIGWDYVVEWYNADGAVIESDGIRINLSNEECHSSIKPYYVNNVIDAAKAYTDEQITNAVSTEVVEF